MKGVSTHDNFGRDRGFQRVCKLMSICRYTSPPCADRTNRLTQTLLSPMPWSIGLGRPISPMHAAVSSRTPSIRRRAPITRSTWIGAFGACFRAPCAVLLLDRCEVEGRELGGSGRARVVGPLIHSTGVGSHRDLRET